MPNPYYNPYWLDPFALEHHGVKNQKWGVKQGPPYPLSRGKDGRVTQTQKKKKQGLIARAKAAHQQKVKAKERAKKAEERKKQKAKEAEQNKTKEQLREELLKSTDPKFIAKHMDLLETREIKDRLDRIDTEAKLKKLLKDDKSKKKIEKGMEWVGNIQKIAETTTKAAGAYTAVYNATQQAEKARREREQAAENKAREKRQDAENRKTSKQLQNIVNQYTKGVDSLGDIKVDFDPKTGKLSFQTTNKKK